MQKRKDQPGYQEKGVDNAITLDMVFEVDNYDVAVLVSVDKDFVETVKRLIDEKGKIVEVAIPHFGKGHHLRQTCSRTRILSDDELRSIFQ